MQVRGDWEFYATVFDFPRWNAEENMCYVCKASGSEPNLLWTTAALTCGWRATVRTHESYLQELHIAGKRASGLFAIVGLRLEGVMIDILHTVDLGLASHILANIFVEIMALWHWGSNQQARASGLHGDIQEWYKSQPSSVKSSKIQGEVTYERIKTSSDWPKLKAKAAATRHLSRYALHLCQRYGSVTEHDKRRLACADLLVRFYDIIEGCSEFLPTRVKAELPTLARLLFGAYNGLSREALSRGVRAWKPYPKFHMFVHLCI